MLAHAICVGPTLAEVPYVRKGRPLSGNSFHFARCKCVRHALTYVLVVWVGVLNLYPLANSTTDLRDASVQCIDTSPVAAALWRVVPLQSPQRVAQNTE